MISAKEAKRLMVFTLAAYASLKFTTLGWYFLAPHYAGRPVRDASPENLKAAVTALASEIGPRDLFNNNKARLRRAEDYILRRFKAAGCKVESQEYLAAGVKVRNLICSKPGLEAPGEVVLVGAHYDTFNNPGADDNASGMAVMLDLADHASDKKFGRTIKFAAFVNEEPPFFRHEGMGSAVYAASAAARGEDIKAAVILEMVGYFTEARASQRYPPFIGPFFPSRGNYIAQISNIRSAKTAFGIADAFRGASTLPLRTAVLPSFVPGADYSDHRSFWGKGYPAVMFTDTAFYRNPNYHKRTDLPGTLNYEYMASLTDGLRAALDGLAGRRK